LAFGLLGFRQRLLLWGLQLASLVSDHIFTNTKSAGDEAETQFFVHKQRHLKLLPEKRLLSGKDRTFVREVRGRALSVGAVLPDVFSSRPQPIRAQLCLSA